MCHLKLSQEWPLHFFLLLSLLQVSDCTEQRVKCGVTLSLNCVPLCCMFVCGWFKSVTIICCYRTFAGDSCHFDLSCQRSEPATSLQPSGWGDRVLQGCDFNLGIWLLLLAACLSCPAELAARCFGISLTSVTSFISRSRSRQFTYVCILPRYS